eukprot:6990132-Prymnesium_polylepis.1
MAGPTRKAWPAPTRLPLLLAEAAHVHAWPQMIQCGDRSAGRLDTRSARSGPTGRPASRSRA